jgi:hypothetical protein
MIRDTLELLKNGSRSTMDIAERLGVGIEDLRQRLRILEDKGLIQKVTDQGGGCSSLKCLGCRGSGCGDSCARSFSGTNVYVLTEKGRRVVKSDS